MQSQSALEFRWLSPFGLSALLFLTWGLVCVVDALLGPFLHRRLGLLSPSPAFSWLIISERFDTLLFGRSPIELARAEPALSTLQLFMVDLMSTLLLGLGILHIGLAWFGLRQGNTWALWALTAADLALVAFYWLFVIVPFARTAPLRISETPPVFWLPTLLVPVATVLGWLGIA